MKANLSALFASADQRLDARGLECPQPVIDCRHKLKQMLDGQTLHIIANDPNTALDFEVFCMRTGHQLLASHTDSATDIHFLIKKQLA